MIVLILMILIKKYATSAFDLVDPKQYFNLFIFRLELPIQSYFNNIFIWHWQLLWFYICDIVDDNPISVHEILKIWTVVFILSLGGLSEPLLDELSLHLASADDRGRVLRVGASQVEVVSAFRDQEGNDRAGNASQDPAG